MDRYIQRPIPPFICPEVPDAALRYAQRNVAWQRREVKKRPMIPHYESRPSPQMHAANAEASPPVEGLRGIQRLAIKPQTAAAQNPPDNAFASYHFQTAVRLCWGLDTYDETLLPV